MTRVWSVLVTCVQLVLWLNAGDAADTKCVQRSFYDLRPDPDDCGVFYTCNGRTLYKNYCLSDFVFNPERNTCVRKGSANDTCSTPVCQRGSDTLIPHESKCSLYYNCSAPARKIYWEVHLQECDEPQVYNPVSRRCEHYSMVDCGNREMPLGHCDYKINQCAAAHCRPCYVDTPSCRDLDDGLHPRPEYPPSPNTSKFIVCKDKRLVYEGQCSKIDNREQIFDPVRKSCVLP